MIPESLRQKCWNDTVWLYIKVLSKAIEEVPVNYRYYDDKSSIRYHMERVFSYELYYRWATILNNNHEENPEKLILNAELSKHYDKDERVKFPDMVLHGDYTNTDKQLVICEIKSGRNYIKTDSFKKDMDSLVKGINKLSYKCGAFIYVGNNEKVIIKKLRAILQTLNYDERRIIFIGANGVDTYYEIL